MQFKHFHYAGYFSTMKVSASIHHLIICSWIALAILLGGSFSPAAAEMNGPILAFLRSCTPQIQNLTPVPTVGKSSPGDYEALVTKAINRFGLALYANLKNEENNLVFSPFSAYAPLAIAYGGATGKTKEEITEVLGVKQAGVPIHPTVGWLTYDLSH
jgi:hypothetical protein